MLPWYLLIGAVSAGAAGTLYALWRAAKAEARAIKAELQAEAATKNAKLWQAELEASRVAAVDAISRKSDEITVLRRQRDEALAILEKSSLPGSVRTSLRMSLGIK
jgi:hypothetical protein